MNSVRYADEHVDSPAENADDWELQPGSGEGSGTALNKLKRAERVKRSWRRVRSGWSKTPGDEGPSSAD
jgi:hypothetical protein